MAGTIHGTRDRQRLSTLHVLLPPFARAAADSAFRAWLARGDVLPELPDTRSATLRELFHFEGGPFPTAAFRHCAAVGTAVPGCRVCADPVYVRGEATGARLMGWPIDDLDPQAAAPLAAALRPLFGDAGKPLDVDAPTAWSLHLPDAAPVPALTHPLDALGVDLLESLPAGAAGRPWRALFNEAQVLLHAHSVNAARRANGRMPVNAVWFWGAGALPAGIDTTVRVIAGSDGVLRGMALVARIRRLDPSPAALDADDNSGASGDALLDLDPPGRPAYAGPWLPSFRKWLAERRFDAIVLVFADGQRFRMRRAHRLRFWRHA